VQLLQPNNKGWWSRENQNTIWRYVVANWLYECGLLSREVICGALALQIWFTISLDFSSQQSYENAPPSERLSFFNLQHILPFLCEHYFSILLFANVCPLSRGLKAGFGYLEIPPDLSHTEPDFPQPSFSSRRTRISKLSRGQFQVPIARVSFFPAAEGQILCKNSLASNVHSTWTTYM
jgi:hypothetical protein